MDLYDKARHEPLNRRVWNEAEARAAIGEIVRDALDHCGDGAVWPLHPLDSLRGETVETSRALYLGATGIIWALHYLSLEDATASDHDWRPALPTLQSAPPFPPINNWHPSPHSYLLGDSAKLLLDFELTESEEAANALARAIKANIDDESREFMWAAPGTALAALFMHDWTDEPRWCELFVASASALWKTFVPSDDAPCRLWTQNLYGHKMQMIGAVHGFAGNVFPIIKGFELLSEHERADWRREIINTLNATAMVEDGLANWPTSVPGETVPLVQHCHGAPGMITSLAGLDAPSDERLDRLLLSGGELVWAAGPLVKGSNLCHGTAGNGYAFLKLFERTGDALWLDRARSFAMHAIDQWKAATHAYAIGRYSLWTGDLGLAVYLWDCVHAKARFPTMDVF